MSHITTAIGLIDELILFIEKQQKLEEKTDECKQQDQQQRTTLEKINEIIIRKPDDFHLHLRDGPSLPLTVPHVTCQYARAIIMPNLVPPVVRTKDALAYKSRIMEHCPKQDIFTPLMTLYLTDSTTKQDIIEAKQSGIIFAVKLYPRGATTNSQNGVTDITALGDVLQTMSEQSVPLLIHGEVTDGNIDVFSRESVFLDTVLPNIVKLAPNLTIVLEHITTRKAVETVEYYQNIVKKNNIGATITCHHLLSNRNEIFKGGINPHLYCLPIIKTEDDRRALIEAAISGKKYYFAGTDSAPHEVSTKEKCCGKAGIYTGFDSLALYAKVFDENGALGKGEETGEIDGRFEAFVSQNGAEFYGLGLSEVKIKLERKDHVVPESFEYLGGKLVPYKCGEVVEWSVVPM